MRILLITVENQLDNREVYLKYTFFFRLIWDVECIVDVK